MGFFRNTLRPQITLAQQYSYTYSIDGTYMSANFSTISSTPNYFMPNVDGPVVIGNHVDNCANMFCFDRPPSNVFTFNYPVTIGSNVRDCFKMFYGCNSFNQPIDIPDSVVNGSQMFSGCSNFNQTVHIPNSLQNAYRMFSCKEVVFDNETMPSSVSNCQWFIDGKASGNIVVDYNVSCNYSNFINIRTAGNRLQVFCPSINTDWVALAGSHTYSTLQDGNGWYNSSYNVYLYNNTREV